MKEILQQPEYLHVLLNHLPIIGLPLGAFALFLALCLRSRPAQVTALAVLALAALAAWPVAATGESAYGSIRDLSDEAGANWLEEHMARADRANFVFYVVAVVAIAGIALPAKWPRAATPFAVAAFALALAGSGVATFIAYPGGKIRHPEFRTGPPPTTTAPATHTHPATTAPVAHTHSQDSDHPKNPHP